MKAATVRRLKLAFWNGYDIQKACAYAGITPETYAEAIRKSRTLYDEMLAAQGYATCLAHTVFADAIRKGDARAAMAYLERKEPERFDLAYIRKFGKASDE